MPWTALSIFSGIAVGTTVAVAIVCSAMGWTIMSPAWSLLVPVAMWAPAAGRHAARRFADRDFRATLPLGRWGTTGAQVVLRPLFIPLAIYGVAYVSAWYSGLAHSSRASCWRGSGRPGGVVSWPFSNWMG
jgi:hypothetical protein